MKIFKENLQSDIQGTIIDLETTGQFDNRFNDSRHYANIRPTLFGFITTRGLEIHCAKSEDSLENIKKKILHLLEKLERPYYSFNALFEMGVLFHSLNKRVVFERELNKERYEAKKFVVKTLQIPNYDDPFHDDGKLCLDAWKKGDIEKIIAHNRADLLKERDILRKRGFRVPDTFDFVEK